MSREGGDDDSGSLVLSVRNGLLATRNVRNDDADEIELKLNAANVFRRS